jgi:hypothetical protein
VRPCHTKKAKQTKEGKKVMVGKINISSFNNKNGQKHCNIFV